MHPVPLPYRRGVRVFAIAVLLPAVYAPLLAGPPGPAEARQRFVCPGIGPAPFAGGDWPHLKTMQVVKGVGRLRFSRADSGRPGNACPDASRECLVPAYVVAGDAVLITPSLSVGSMDNRVSERSVNGYACSVYTHPETGRTTTAYLPLRSLALVGPSLLDRADWAGAWRRSYENPVSAADAQRIEIEPLGGGRFSLHGVAAVDPHKVRTAKNALIGAFDLVAEPGNGEFAFSVDGDGKARPYGADPDAGADSPCRIRMWRTGPYLIAQDNLKCGDGVGFSGAYRRRH